MAARAATMSSRASMRRPAGETRGRAEDPVDARLVGPDRPEAQDGQPIARSPPGRAGAFADAAGEDDAVECGRAVAIAAMPAAARSTNMSSARRARSSPASAPPRQAAHVGRGARNAEQARPWSRSSATLSTASRRRAGARSRMPGSIEPGPGAHHQSLERGHPHRRGDRATAGTAVTEQPLPRWATTSPRSADRAAEQAGGALDGPGHRQAVEPDSGGPRSRRPADPAPGSARPPPGAWHGTPCRTPRHAAGPGSAAAPHGSRRDGDRVVERRQRRRARRARRGPRSSMTVARRERSARRGRRDGRRPSTRVGPAPASSEAGQLRQRGRAQVDAAARVVAPVGPSRRDERRAGRDAAARGR